MAQHFVRLKGYSAKSVSGLKERFWASGILPTSAPVEDYESFLGLAV
jgi:hypothetical protein